MPLSIMGVALSIALASGTQPSRDEQVTVRLFQRGPMDPALPPPNYVTGEIGVDVVFPVEPNIRALADVVPEFRHRS